MDLNGFDDIPKRTNITKKKKLLKSYDITQNQKVSNNPKNKNNKNDKNGKNNKKNKKKRKLEESTDLSTLVQEPKRQKLVQSPADENSFDNDTSNTSTVKTDDQYQQEHEYRQKQQHQTDHADITDDSNFGIIVNTNDNNTTMTTTMALGYHSINQNGGTTYSSVPPATHKDDNNLSLSSEPTPEYKHTERTYIFESRNIKEMTRYFMKLILYTIMDQQATPSTLTLMPIMTTTTFCVFGEPYGSLNSYYDKNNCWYFEFTINRNTTVDELIQKLNHIMNNIKNIKTFKILEHVVKEEQDPIIPEHDMTDDTMIKTRRKIKIRRNLSPIKSDESTNDYHSTISKVKKLSTYFNEEYTLLFSNHTGINVGYDDENGNIRWMIMKLIFGPYNLIHDYNAELMHVGLMIWWLINWLVIKFYSVEEDSVFDLFIEMFYNYIEWNPSSYHYKIPKLSIICVLMLHDKRSSYTTTNTNTNDNNNNNNDDSYNKNNKDDKDDKKKIKDNNRSSYYGSIIEKKRFANIKHIYLVLPYTNTINHGDSNGNNDDDNDGYLIKTVKMYSDFMNSVNDQCGGGHDSQKNNHHPSSMLERIQSMISIIDSSSNDKKKCAICVTEITEYDFVCDIASDIYNKLKMLNFGMELDGTLLFSLNGKCRIMYGGQQNVQKEQIQQSQQRDDSDGLLKSSFIQTFGSCQQPTFLYGGSRRNYIWWLPPELVLYFTKKEYMLNLYKIVTSLNFIVNIILYNQEVLYLKQNFLEMLYHKLKDKSISIYDYADKLYYIINNNNNSNTSNTYDNSNDINLEYQKYDGFIFDINPNLKTHQHYKNSYKNTLIIKSEKRTKLVDTPIKIEPYTFINFSILLNYYMHTMCTTTNKCAQSRRLRKQATNILDCQNSNRKTTTTINMDHDDDDKEDNVNENTNDILIVTYCNLLQEGINLYALSELKMRDSILSKNINLNNNHTCPKWTITNKGIYYEQLKADHYFRMGMGNYYHHDDNDNATISGNNNNNNNDNDKIRDNNHHYSKSDNNVRMMNWYFYNGTKNDHGVLYTMSVKKESSTITIPIIDSNVGSDTLNTKSRVDKDDDMALHEITLLSYTGTIQTHEGGSTTSHETQSSIVTYQMNNYVNDLYFKNNNEKNGPSSNNVNNDNNGIPRTPCTKIIQKPITTSLPLLLCRYLNSWMFEDEKDVSLVKNILKISLAITLSLKTTFQKKNPHSNTSNNHNSLKDKYIYNSKKRDPNSRHRFIPKYYNSLVYNIYFTQTIPLLNPDISMTNADIPDNTRTINNSIIIKSPILSKTYGWLHPNPNNYIPYKNQSEEQKTLYDSYWLPSFQCQLFAKLLYEECKKKVSCNNDTSHQTKHDSVNNPSHPSQVHSFDIISVLTFMVTKYGSIAEQIKTIIKKSDDIISLDECFSEIHYCLCKYIRDRITHNNTDSLLSPFTLKIYPNIPKSISDLIYYNEFKYIGLSEDDRRQLLFICGRQPISNVLSDYLDASNTNTNINNNKSITNLFYKLDPQEKSIVTKLLNIRETNFYTLSFDLKSTESTFKVTDIYLILYCEKNTSSEDLSKIIVHSIPITETFFNILLSNAHILLNSHEF